MRDRAWLISSAALLAIAIVVGSYSIGGGIGDRGRNDTIAVTGSAKQRITSDYVIWDASVTSQRATPQAAAQELNAWAGKIHRFLKAQGVLASELTLAPITAQAVQAASDNGNGKIIGYALTRNFEVRSARVARIAAVVERSSQLLAAGIPIQFSPIQYIFTKLASVRPGLLAAATKDALGRARILVGATGGHLGALREVNVGVFQVTSPNSTDVSDYGEYDTSTLEKDVTAVVNVSFALS
jgi:hypothetical protein